MAAPPPPLAPLPALVTQLEFWFSDANLVRDKFLRGKLEEEGDARVAATVIAGFKKVAELIGKRNGPAVPAVEHIVAAARASPLLRVSDDGKRIGRVAPLRPAEPVNADERTVYCELYPPTFAHDDLRALFSAAGRVAYVSMPRYHNSRAFKGFAFVEFETAASARAACSQFDGWLPPGVAPGPEVVAPATSPSGEGAFLCVFVCECLLGNGVVGSVCVCVIYPCGGSGECLSRWYVFLSRGDACLCVCQMCPARLCAPACTC